MSSGPYIAIAVLVGFPRLIGVNNQAYQAIAHLYMGSAITLWFQNGPGLWMWIVLVLSSVEVACFIRDKISGWRKPPSSLIRYERES